MSEENQNANIIDNLDTPTPVDSSTREEAGLIAELQLALTAKAEEVKGLNDK